MPAARPLARYTDARRLDLIRVRVARRDGEHWADSRCGGRAFLALADGRTLALFR